MKQQEVLESFTYRELINDQEHNYRVTAHEKQYAVELDGKFVDEMICDEGGWRSVKGGSLDAQTISQIGERIEAHFS